MCPPLLYFFGFYNNELWLRFPLSPSLSTSLSLPTGTKKKGSPPLDKEKKRKKKIKRQKQGGRKERRKGKKKNSSAAHRFRVPLRGSLRQSDASVSSSSSRTCSSSSCGIRGICGRSRRPARMEPRRDVREQLRDVCAFFRARLPEVEAALGGVGRGVGGGDGPRGSGRRSSIVSARL